MRLRVANERPVVAAHKLRLPGEVFEVSEKLGRALLTQRPEALVACDGIAGQGRVPDAAPSDAQRHPTLAPVSRLNLSARVLDALHANAIETVEDLRRVLAKGDETILALPGIGPRALEEIKAALDAVAGGA